MRFSINDYEPKDIIKFIRDYTNLTQKEFSKRIGKSYDWVQSVELGRLSYKFDDLVMICKIFNINIIIESNQQRKKIFQDL